MIEVSLKYLNKLKFEKYARELFVKYNISPDLVDLNYEHCRLLIDATEDDVKELVKDRLVLMVRETKGKKK
jgi:hypothetical protein